MEVFNQMLSSHPIDSLLPYSSKEHCPSSTVIVYLLELLVTYINKYKYICSFSASFPFLKKN